MRTKKNARGAAFAEGEQVIFLDKDSGLCDGRVLRIQRRDGRWCYQVQRVDGKVVTLGEAELRPADEL